MTDQPDDLETRRFLPLPTPTLHILVALRGKERHGYAVMQEVEALSDGAVHIGPGTLYGAIKRLLAEGLVIEVGGDARDDERRRYYRLSDLGERVCEAELSRLVVLVRRARRSPSSMRLREA